MKKSVWVSVILWGAILQGASLEPRLYSNVPKGFNFLVVGYGHTEGALADNTALELTDPKLQVNSAVVGYARGFGIGGMSAKAGVVLPAMCIDGTAKQNGAPVARHVCGAGDAKISVSVNLFGAPALSMKRFASYRQDTIVGVSLQVTTPTGQYERDRLVNIGTNRWAIKPGVGISKAVARFIFELAADAEFYTANEHFLGDITRKQEPVYSTQGHVIYTFKNHVWIGLDANYFWGGEYVNDGQHSGEVLDNSRLGATLAIPINRYHSLKFYGSSGVSTRVGTDFDMLGVLLQYRWAEGY